MNNLLDGDKIVCIESDEFITTKGFRLGKQNNIKQNITYTFKQWGAANDIEVYEVPDVLYTSERFTTLMNYRSMKLNKIKRKMKYDKVKIGKHLSFLLRHKKGFVDTNGWVDVNTVLQELKIPIEVLDDIVENNNKKRYSYDDDKTQIRANQGHTLKVDVELEVKTPPSTLYHGTSPDFVDSILKRGINKMKRQHVHLSDNLDTAINVGKRHSKGYEPSIFKVDCLSMVDDGYKFYISKNGVWLTDNIPTEYLMQWQ